MVLDDQVPQIHISIDCPDGTAFPAYDNSEIDKVEDWTKIILEAVRKKCLIPRKYKFTHDGKNFVEDEKTLEYYVKLTPENYDRVYPPPPDSDTVRSTDRPPTLPKVILKLVLGKQVPDKTDAPALNDQFQNLIDQTQDPAQKQRLRDLYSQYMASQMNFAAIPGGEVSSPFDLDEKKWDMVLGNNQALHGLSVSRDQGSYQISRSPKPAFAFQKPAPPPDNADPLDKQYYELIPAYPTFFVSDESHVTVTEVKTAWQKTLATSGFHSTSVEASVSAEGFGASGAVTAENSTSSREEETAMTDELHVSYNFPRVVLLLDASSLSLSPECIAELNDLADAIKNNRDLDVLGFWRTFGTAFPQRLVLGGRLYSSKKLSEDEQSKMEESKSALRIAAGMNFSCPWANASFSVNNTDKDSKSVGNSSLSDSLAINWDASGGNTLLCSNPPAWAGTVGDYKFWRTMEQSDVTNVSDLILSIDPTRATVLRHPAFLQEENWLHYRTGLLKDTYSKRKDTGWSDQNYKITMGTDWSGGDDWQKLSSFQEDLWTDFYFLRLGYIYAKDEDNKDKWEEWLDRTAPDQKDKLVNLVATDDPSNSRILKWFTEHRQLLRRFGEDARKSEYHPGDQ